MVYVAIVLGGLAFIASAVVIIVWNAGYAVGYFRHIRSYSWVLFILAAVFIVFGIILLTSVCFKTNDLNLCGEYLEKGVQVLKKENVLFLLIPIFMILTTGLIALCWFQLLSYWSHSELVFHNT